MGWGGFAVCVAFILIRPFGALALSPIPAGAAGNPVVAANPIGAGIDSTGGIEAAEAGAEDAELSSAEFDLLEALALFIGGSSLSARVRAAAFGIDDGAPGRAEMLAAAGSASWKAAWRSREYGSWNACSGADAAGFISIGSRRSNARAVLGDCIPSFGMGLLAGGTAFSYPFDRAYPFSRTGGVVGTTSLTGGKLRGASAAFGRAPLSLQLVGGEKVCAAACVGRGERIAGGRVGLTVGRCALGASSIGPLAGFDLEWAAPPLRLCFEAAGRIFRAVGFACGLRMRGVRSGAALMAWSVPSGAQGALGIVDGEGLDGERSVSGGVIVLARRLPRGVALRGAASRRIAAGGGRTRLRDELRLEIERTGRLASGKMAWLESRVRERDDLHCPPCLPAEEAARRTVSAAGRLLLDRRWECKVHLRVPFGDGAAGALVSPGLAVEAVREHCTLNLCAAWRRAMYGNPVFSFPEPAFPGSYPWRTAWGTGRSCAVIINIFNNILQISCKVRLEVGKSPDFSAMGSVEF